MFSINSWICVPIFWNKILNSALTQAVFIGHNRPRHRGGRYVVIESRFVDAQTQQRREQHCQQLTDCKTTSSRRCDA